MRRKRHIILNACLMAILASSARASMTLLAGPSLATHVGNLVTNGSFETGSPGPGPGNVQYWATGTTLTPFAVPPGWSSIGPGAPSSNYAQWGADSGSSPWTLRGSDTLADGNVGMYFGNGITTFSLPGTYLPSGRVTYPGIPVSSKGAPVELWQSVPTQLTPSPSYLLSFWVSGEDAVPASGWGEGVFGLQVTNVLVGDPIQYFAVPSGSGPQGASRRYEFLFTPINPLSPVTIDFLNWGHVFTSQMNTELVLDDVIINTVPEPASLVFLGMGSLAVMRKRRKIESSKSRNESNPTLGRFDLTSFRSLVFFLVLIGSLFPASRTAQATMTQNTGPQVATPSGNLVTNGSFETGAPAPGFANQVYWATGTANSPFAVPAGWTSSGQSQTYALWGSGPGTGIEFSDTIPDGQAALYFGNASTSVTPAPSFGPNHTVSFSSAPTFNPFYGGPCRLNQTVNTPATPAPSYVLNFWVSGEDASSSAFAQQGVFGLKVTNVLPGDPVQYFAVPNNSILPSYRLEFFFTPINPLAPVTIEFTNWGHITATPGQINLFDSTELVIDDVIINALPEPASLILLAGGCALWRRRPRSDRETF